MSRNSQGNGGPQGRAARCVIQALEDLQRAGVTHFPKPPNLPATQPKPSLPLAATSQIAEGQPQRLTAQLSQARQPPVPPAESPAPALPTLQEPCVVEDRPAALAKISERVAVCTRCAELARTRNKTVFGSGNPRARLVFMGEAPGADEDRQGLPFVGAAGTLLTDIIVKGMKLRREDVYILNTLKCRPPGNRTPTADEAANCREYLDAQLAIIQPEYICCLGAVAAQNLLNTTTTIGKLRGAFHEYRGIKVICTYHPAYLLRTPSAKRQTWEDIQMLMREMGLQ